MNRVLQEAKRKVRDRLLGRWGIHGVGAREEENALYLYVHEDGGEDRDVAIRQIEQEISPLKLKVVREQPPRVA